MCNIIISFSLFLFIVSAGPSTFSLHADDQDIGSTLTPLPSTDPMEGIISLTNTNNPAQ